MWYHRSVTCVVFQVIWPAGMYTSSLTMVTISVRSFPPAEPVCLPFHSPPIQQNALKDQASTLCLPKHGLPSSRPGTNAPGPLTLCLHCPILIWANNVRHPLPAHYVLPKHPYPYPPHSIPKVPSSASRHSHVHCHSPLPRNGWRSLGLDGPPVCHHTQWPLCVKQISI